MSRRRSFVVLGALAALVLSGCTSSAPEMPLPDVPQGVVTDLSGGLEERFTLTMEQLTGASPGSCDERGDCTLTAHAWSPEGTLLVTAHHSDAPAHVIAGVDSESGEVRWTLESETGADVVHSSRHGMVLVDREKGEGGDAYGELLVLDSSDGTVLREIEIEDETVVGAEDTDHGIAVSFMQLVPSDTEQDPAFYAVGLGENGEEHWRTELEPPADSSRAVHVDVVEGKVEISQLGRDFSYATVALLDPATGKQSPVPEDHVHRDARGSLPTDDLSAGRIAIRSTDSRSWEISPEGAEPWSLESTDSRAIGPFPRAVCSGTLILSDSADPSSAADDSGQTPPHIMAFDAMTGEEKWSTPLEADSTMLCAGEDVLVHDRTTAYLLDGSTGEIRESYELAPGAIPIPEGSEYYDVPIPLTITPTSRFTEGSDIALMTHEEGEPPQITVYR